MLILHEMGHYLAARAFSMPIKEGVIGRGKHLKSWQGRHGVKWHLHLWPLGAHVQIDEMDQRPFHQKTLTILAGPCINFTIALPLFFGFYLMFGQPSMPNVVAGVEQNLPADQSGIKPGDRFLAIDSIPLKNFDDIWRIAYKRGAVQSTYTVQRGDDILDVKIKPGWIEYKDRNGVPRKNARFGIVWEHTPFSFDSILSVNGREVGDDKSLIRNALIESLDKSVLIGLKGPDDGTRYIRFTPRKEYNAGLFDKDSDYHDVVFLGSENGNKYMRAGAIENLIKASRYSLHLLKNIAKVPFQIFPIDKSQIQNEAAVANPDTKIANYIYKFIHLFVITSIAIGLINLLPFPSLDGGQLIDQTLKAVCGDALSSKRRAKVFAALFFLLYLSVFISNMDNLHGYIDSSIKKVHELIGD